MRLEVRSFSDRLISYWFDAAIFFQNLVYNLIKLLML